jgi:DNA-binding transcriptional MerR regulator
MVPYKEPKIEKIFYSIGEVAEMLNVNQSLIRFWEKEFDILKPQKNKKGNRLFTQQDIENLRLIYHLVKERGMTLKGARLKLQNQKQEIVDSFEIVKKLQNIKENLLSIKSELELTKSNEEPSLP